MSKDSSLPEIDFNKLLSWKNWEDFFYRTPCVRSSFLWGMGCGSMMAAHKLRLYRGQVGRAVNAAVLTFVVVSSGNFLICANDVNTKYDMIKQAFQQKNMKEDRSNRPQP